MRRNMLTMNCRQATGSATPLESMYLFLNIQVSPFVQSHQEEYLETAHVHG